MDKTYLNWDTKITEDFSHKNIESLHNKGYLFTRIGLGVMNKTRSFRIDLDDFEMSSENRRIERKSDDLILETATIPYKEYSWQIAKLGKDFYEKKFGDKTFSANKIKELLTSEKTNFNFLLIYKDKETKKPLAYVICKETENIIHYSYPFYIQDEKRSSRGLGMMILAIQYAKNNGKKYIYLGSLQRPTDTYKLQFQGGEWFDGQKWQRDINPLKEILL